VSSKESNEDNGDVIGLQCAKHTHTHIDTYTYVFMSVDVCVLK